MAYTGTGTQDDPYIVDNWTDFKALCGSKIYIAFDPNAENKVIDLIDTEDRAGLSEELTVGAVNVEGNGWVIRNLATNTYNITAPANRVPIIQNLHFHNIIGQSDYVFHYNFHFINCTFSGVLLNVNKLFGCGPSSDSVADNCAFNLRLCGSDPSITPFHNSQMNNCNIHLTGKAPTYIINKTSTTTHNKLNNCKITGDLTLNGGTFNMTRNSSDPNNLWAVRVTGTGTVAATDNAAEPCIIDTDLIADTITLKITGKNRFALTTAQMQDAEYLMNTIGFPCVEA